ncbi:DUF1254 domain-containing protein [Streptomyces sp. NPDC058231]|uniref:DUF1254 domain-containing protein n=1 Tax=Streptomyces sp. NPDC058231 TaxID=3346392 RepID=UPI0036EECC3F
MAAGTAEAARGGGGPGQEELTALAAEAYVYGYPLVSGLSLVESCTQEGFGALAPAPFNHFSHADRPERPDAYPGFGGGDTVCSAAQLDLSGGPLRLHVPDTGGAYYVLQFVDAWTNNFAYLGSRATGTGSGDWLIVPPGWAGEEPGGVRGVIDAPTAVVSLVGRIACDGPDDLPRVRALQEQFSLTHVEPGSHRTGLPAPDTDVPERLAFFERLRVWTADFPPAAADRAYQDRFQPLGLLEEGPSPYVSAGPALVRALAEGMTQGRARVVAAGRSGAPVGGGWEMDPHLHDYNLDRFEVGTIDSTEWKIADREASYLVRAVAARQGLWGSHGYEVACAQTCQDSDGNRLHGAHSYALRFEQPPPAGAFWTLTVSGSPEPRPVGNPADRHAIGDRTPGLVRADDGTLTVHIGGERPADPAAVNWLPAPDGEFRPVLRLYTPGRAALDGSYAFPAVELRER